MKWSDLLREAAPKYEEGRSLESLATEYGVTRFQLTKRLRDRVALRPKCGPVRKPPPSDLPRNTIVERYRNMTGTIYGMASEYRCRPEYIRDVLIAAGLTIRRPGAIAALLRHRKRSPEIQARNADIVARLRDTAATYQQLADEYHLDFRHVAVIARNAGLRGLRGKYVGAREVYCPHTERHYREQRKARRLAATRTEQHTDTGGSNL